MGMDQQEIPSVFEKVFHDDYLVEKIAKNIPLKQRWNLAATDRRLYSIICELDAKKHIIRLTQEHFDDTLTIASIINSKRKFEKIGIRNFENNHLNILKKIAEIHGQTVKELNCSWGSNSRDADDLPHMEAFDAKKLEAFFEKLPNLDELDMSSFGPNLFVFENMIGECNIVIKNLTKFRFYESFLSMLRRGITDRHHPSPSFKNFSSLIASNTVEEFEYSRFNAECRNFIKRQAKIKTIKVSDMTGPANFSHLKLENILSIPSGEGSDAFLQKIFEDHGKTLKKLKAESNMISEDTIGVLCERLQLLEYLSIKPTNENVQSFIALDRLKSLKSLNIDCTEHEFNRYDLLLNLTRLKLPNLKEVKIATFNNEHDFDEIVRNIGENWENLEKLQVDQVFEMLHGGTTSMNATLEHVRKLKVLGFNDHSSEREIFHVTFNYNGQTYPLMEELTIGWCRDWSFITTLNIFPNLRKLISAKCPYGGPLHLKGIVALKKLKELRIWFVVESSLVTPTQEEISLFKHLCRQVEEFWITIESPLASDFCSILTAALSDYVDRVYGRQNSLVLRSQKY